MEQNKIWGIRRVAIDIEKELESDYKNLETALDEGWEPYAVVYAPRYLIYFFRKKLE